MKNRRLTFFIVVFSSFVIFGGFAASAFAQDAIQCKPPSDPSSGVNLINNFRMVNTNDTLNDIYLGTGEIYFGGTFVNTPYATNSGGNLLLRNDSANITAQSNTILFQNTASNRLVGIYNAGPVTGASANGKFLIVDGKIEGWAVNAVGTVPGGGLCIQGSCIDSWDQAAGGPGSHISYFTTNNGWTEMKFESQSRLIMEGGSTFIVQNGAKINNYGIYQVCQDILGNDTLPETDANYATRFDENICNGTGKGVSLIKQGTGIKITGAPNPPSAGSTSLPPYGEGDVTIENTGVLKLTPGTNVTLTPATGMPAADGSVKIDVTIPAPSITCLLINFASVAGVPLHHITACPANFKVTGIWDQGFADGNGQLICCK